MHAPSGRLTDETPAKDLLRFITCGSVDDGKSTLIGRLLHDSKLIFEDQLSTLAKDSKRHGTTGEDIDFALLVDGLEAEREQGITIDVAYRFFTTPKRSFIVADTPGHEQYTRNMATGASNAELAIILVDARKGVLVQTRRHSLICSLLKIRHVVVAINKIDLVGYRKEVFEHMPITPPLPHNWVSPRCAHPDIGAIWRQRHGRSARCPGIAVRRFSTTSKQLKSKPTTLGSHFGFRCNG